MHETELKRIFLAVSILSVSLCVGVPETTFSHIPLIETRQNVVSDQRLSLKVPQGDEGFAVEKEKEQPRPQEEIRTLPKTPKSKAKPRRKGTPLKEFVPSEKIPADQEVDFPADI